MQQGEVVEGVDFVALEMADEMPHDGDVDIGHLGERFLNTGFATVMDSGVPGGECSFGAVGLSHGDEGDGLSMTTTCDRPRNPGPDFGNSHWEVRKNHSHEI